MPGGLMQLIAYGAQDVYLNDAPDIYFHGENNLEYKPSVKKVKEKSIYEKQLEYISNIIIDDDIIDDDIIEDDILDDDVIFFEY
jgi:hypothetical protein